MPLGGLDGRTAASGTAVDHSESFKNDEEFVTQDDECWDLQRLVKQPTDV
jgi:hypothetical protein